MRTASSGDPLRGEPPRGERVEAVIVDPGVPHPVDEELVLPGQEDAAGVLVLRGNRILIGKYPSLL